jgi:hypothetical protein
MVFLKVQQVTSLLLFIKTIRNDIGTGKTLSLLCASLAWLEQYKIHNLDSNGNII